MNSDQIIETVQNYTQLSDTQLDECLEQLGTALRESDFRNDSSTVAVIPTLVDIFNVVVSKPELYLQVLRVFVNLTADSDNRLVLVDTETDAFHEFWKNISNKILESAENDRLVLLLTQFIHDTDRLPHFVSFFNRIGITTGLVKLLRSPNEENIDELVNVSELLAEICSHIEPAQIWSSITLEDLEELLRFAHVVNCMLADETAEILVFISTVFIRATSIQDLSECGGKLPLYQPLIKLLEDLNSADEGLLTARRQFFASCGNITSMPSYDGEEGLQFNLHSLRETKNAYARSAVAIGLGNFVHDASTQARLREVFVNDEYVELYLNMSFNDMCQYQALHLANVTINPQFANLLYTGENTLQSFQTLTKAVVDNAAYYKEVFVLYANVLLKLINSSEIKDLYHLDPVLDYIQACDDKAQVEHVYLTLLKKVFKDFDFASTLILKEITVRAMKYACSDQNLNNVSVLLLLDKIQALAIAVPWISDVSQLTSEDPEEVFFSPLKKFLQSLPLSETPETQAGPAKMQFQALVNNSKFVAATVLNHFPNRSDLSDICTPILRAPIKD